MHEIRSDISTNYEYFVSICFVKAKAKNLGLLVIYLKLIEKKNEKKKNNQAKSEKI